MEKDRRAQAGSSPKPQATAIDYFTAFRAGLTGVDRASSSFGDVNGDGHLDLLITGQDANDTPTARLYLGDGTGDFTEKSAGLTGVYLGSSTFGDVNGDGHLDLLLTGLGANGTRTATLYLGDGSGGFTEKDAGLTGVYSSSSTFGDVNGDGHLDLLITGQDANDTPTATLYLGDGTGNFTEKSAGLTGVYIGSSTVGDVNGDGHLDLIITGAGSNGLIATMYLGNGTGEFTEQGAGLTGVSQGSSSFGDVDNDGNVDLLITGRDANLDPTATLYLGDGSGGFTEQGAGLIGVERGSSSFGDADGDGHLDLLITGQDANNDPTATLYLGDGTSDFTEKSAGLTDVRGKSSSSFGDVDNDGNVDLLITGKNANTVQTATLYENLTSKDFQEAAQTQTVSGNETAQFGSAGVSVQFQGTSGSGDVTVQRFSNAPNNALGTQEPNVSSYRFALSAAGDLTFSDNTEVRLDVSTLSGISDPSTVTVYKRPVRGNGLFAPLPTSYDAGAGQLVAQTGSFSEFVLVSGDASNPLPVELTAFDATTSGEKVTLRWTAASETGNAGFEVQHRADSSAAWQKLGFVESKAEGGTATTPQQYRYSVGGLGAGTHRFRLQQVDIDGSKRYSEVIEASVRMQAAYRLSTYPNPAARQATVEVTVREKQAVTLRLYDTLGRQVATLHEGPLPAQETKTLRLDAGRLDLSSGTYFLRVRGESGTETSQFTVVR